MNKIICNKKNSEVQQQVEEDGKILPPERTSSPAIESTGLETRARKKANQEILRPLEERMKVREMEKKQFGELEKKR